MFLKKKLLIVLLYCAAASALPAQMRYGFTSEHDSVSVTRNGSVLGQLPYQERVFMLFPRRMEYVFTAPGFYPDTVVFKRKPEYFDENKQINLRPLYPQYPDLDSATAVVAFDKLVAEFNDGQSVGRIERTVDNETESEAIRWDGYIRTSDQSTAEQMNSILEAMHFNTPTMQHSRTFGAESQHRAVAPRFRVGGKITTININAIHGKHIPWKRGRYYRTTVDLTIEWQIRDAVNNTVVYSRTVTTQDNSLTLSTNVTAVLTDGFVKSFRTFLADDELYRLAKNAPAATSASIPASDSTAIPLLPTPTYAASGEMIRTSSQACGTVLTESGHGSGFFVSADGLFITAEHVVAGASSVRIKLHNGPTLDAQVIRTDAVLDVALLRVSGTGYPALPLLQDPEPEIGDDVFAIGTPADVELGNSVSRGIVSGRRRIEERVLIQTDASVSPGNSGGPLLNAQGSVVGVVQSKVVAQGTEGIGFALPIARALNALGVVVR